MAKPNLMAFITASLFNTGKVPGYAKLTKHAFSFAGKPNSVEAPEKIFVFVVN